VLVFKNLDLAGNIFLLLNWTCVTDCPRIFIEIMK